MTANQDPTYWLCGWGSHEVREGGRRTGRQELDAGCVICITVAQVINILHAKWDKSWAQKVFPALPGDLGHTSWVGEYSQQKVNYKSLRGQQLTYLSEDMDIGKAWHPQTEVPQGVESVKVSLSMRAPVLPGTAGG